MPICLAFKTNDSARETQMNDVAHPHCEKNNFLNTEMDLCYFHTFFQTISLESSQAFLIFSVNSWLFLDFRSMK